MSKTRLEWKVGLFVLIGLVLLAVLLLQFSKGMSLLRPTYDILLRSENVGGLKERAGVLMAGVQVGSVAEMRLAPEGKHVTITLRIYRKYKIHKDARFVLEQSGFLGDQYVSIIPTENKLEIFQHLDPAVAETPFNLQEVARTASGFIQRIEATAKKLNEALEDIRKNLINQQTLTNVALALENLRGVSERALVIVDRVEAVVLTNAPSLNQSSSNLVIFTESLNRFSASINSIVETNQPGINSIVKNLEESTATLNSVMNDLESGKGLAGNLLKNEQLSTNVSQITHNLSVTTSNLNRLGLWGILWKKKEPKNEAPPAERLTAPKQNR